MSIGSSNLPKITLSVNELNSPIERHGVAKWIKKKKNDLVICCLQKTDFKFKYTQRLKVKEW